MKTIVVVIHTDVLDDSSIEAYWADSPDVPNWTAGGESIPDLKKSVEEGLNFFLIEPVQIAYRTEARSS